MQGNLPWWVAKDVCDVLGLTNPTMAVQELDDDERAKYCLGRQGDTNIINEPGLYSLILRSRKPEARAFKRWITHEVLPTIRKTGEYTVPTTPVHDQPPLPEYDQVTKLLQMLRMGIREHLFSEHTERSLRLQIAETVLGESLTLPESQPSLPPVERKDERPQWVKDGYGAKAIGHLAKCHHVKIGHLAKKYNLQTP